VPRGAALFRCVPDLFVVHQARNAQPGNVQIRVSALVHKGNEQV
jgi:hypothetical protein